MLNPISNHIVAPTDPNVMIIGESGVGKERDSDTPTTGAHVHVIL